MLQPVGAVRVEAAQGCHGMLFWVKAGLRLCHRIKPKCCILPAWSALSQGPMGASAVRMRTRSTSHGWELGACLAAVSAHPTVPWPGPRPRFARILLLLKPLCAQCVRSVAAGRISSLGSCQHKLGLGAGTTPGCWCCSMAPTPGTPLLPYPGGAAG